MKTPPVIVVAAAMLLWTAAPVAQAEDSGPAMKPASSVAEMLQRRQESQLREQFVREGRWDEVRKLDEAQAQRQHERQLKVVAQMNDELARTAKPESAVTTATLDPCDKESLRLRQLKSANAGKNAVETTTY